MAKNSYAESVALNETIHTPYNSNIDNRTFCDKHNITIDDVNEICGDYGDPYFISFFIGFADEMEFRRRYLFDNSNITNIKKPFEKGDWGFSYKGVFLRAEVKHAASPKGNPWKASINVDRRDAGLEGTRNRLITEFDILCMDVFNVIGEHEFFFAPTKILPRKKGFDDGVWSQDFEAVCDQASEGKKKDLLEEAKALEQTWEKGLQKWS